MAAKRARREDEQILRVRFSNAENTPFPLGGFVTGDQGIVWLRISPEDIVADRRHMNGYNKCGT